MLIVMQAPVFEGGSRCGVRSCSSGRHGVGLCKKKNRLVIMGSFQLQETEARQSQSTFEISLFQDVSLGSFPSSYPFLSRLFFESSDN